MLVMVAVAWLIERLVLGKLVNQEGITLLMATLGITYFLDGFGQTIFGSDIYKIDVGLPKDPMFLFESIFQGGVLVNKEDLYAAVIAAALVVAAGAVLPEHRPPAARCARWPTTTRPRSRSASRSTRIWVIVWSVAGFVALVAGIIWGSKLGVQFSLSLVALKALPVVILGGLTSVPGAIIGGLIIGVGEKLSEVFIGPMIGGGIEIWFAYVLALFVPARAGRKACSARRSSTASEPRTDMLYRENGQFKTSYRADQQIFPIAQDRIVILALLAFAFVGVPLAGRRVPVPRDPDPVPDPVAGGARA